jgi:geranylgeranyl diphosphate synthase type I
MLQDTIRESGAVEDVERIIRRNAGLAREALQDAPIAPSAREELLGLVDTVVTRSA